MKTVSDIKNKNAVSSQQHPPQLESRHMQALTLYNCSLFAIFRLLSSVNVLWVYLAH